MKMLSTNIDFLKKPKHKRHFFVYIIYSLSPEEKCYNGGKKMDKKTLLSNIRQKLRMIREPLRYSQREMADRLGIYCASYSRHESGETMPMVTTLYKLGNIFNISLDWLVQNKGPMYYKEKEETGSNGEISKELRKDVSELLEHMEQILLLRYEILASFHKFKEEHKEMVMEAMKAAARPT